MLRFFCKISKAGLYAILMVCCFLMSKVPSASGAVAAEKPKKIFMVLWLGIGETLTETAFKDYFKLKNRNVEFVVRDANEDKAKLAEIVKEIRQTKPDLIYVYSSVPAVEIIGTLDKKDPQTNITDIPIVAYALDPVSLGLIKEMGPTGRNWTGVSILVEAKAQLHAIQMYAPFKKIAAIYSPLEPNAVVSVKDLKAQAVEKGLEFAEMPFGINKGKTEISSIEPAIQKAKQWGAELIYLPVDGFIASHIEQISKYLIDYQLPSFTSMELCITKPNSALFAMVAGAYAAGQNGAKKADEILFKGKKPGEIPFEKLQQLSFLIRKDTLSKIKYYPSLKIIELAEFVE